MRRRNSNVLISIIWWQTSSQRCIWAFKPKERQKQNKRMELFFFSDEATVKRLPFSVSLCVPFCVYPPRIGEEQLFVSNRASLASPSPLTSAPFPTVRHTLFSWSGGSRLETVYQWHKPQEVWIGDRDGDEDSCEKVRDQETGGEFRERIL